MISYAPIDKNVGAYFSVGLTAPHPTTTGTGTRLKTSAVPYNPSNHLFNKNAYNLSAIDHVARENGRTKSDGHCLSFPIFYCHTAIY